jgi:acyl homoserine lactone synthase
MTEFAVSRPGDRARFAPSIRDMYKLRAEVFATRLNWDVTCINGQERDQFDDLDPSYIMHPDASGRVDGSFRLLPTTGSYMLKDVFSQLLGSHQPPNDERIWEVSRFAVMPPDRDDCGLGSLHRITQELLIQLLAVGLANNLTAIVTVTEVRFERVLQRAGLTTIRYRKPMRIGDTQAVAGHTPVTIENLARLIRRRDELFGQATATPVVDGRVAA